MARFLRLSKGSIVVEDLGYTDYAWYAQLTTQRIFFVSRQKRNAAYEVLKRRDVNKSQGLLSDQTIWLIGVKSLECPFSLRRITYRDPASGKRYVFLTNRLKLSAKTNADIYKESWQIEIFFRWIKQNLRIRAFSGNSKNAVLSQIVAALLVCLLLCYLNFLCNLGITLQNLIRLLQLNLFRRCSFKDLSVPSSLSADIICDSKQLTLALA